jgi:hypothetical protein
MGVRTLHLTKTYGIRLSGEDRVKLEQLCTHMNRPASEVLRLLVRMAQPVDVPPIRFGTPSEQRTVVG